MMVYTHGTSNLDLNNEPKKRKKDVWILIAECTTRNDDREMFADAQCGYDLVHTTASTQLSAYLSQFIQACAPTFGF